MASSNIGALLLSSTLETSVIEPTSRHQRALAARYVRLPARREPLDLSASVFRYLETIDGRVLPVDDRLRKPGRCSLVTCCRDRALSARRVTSRPALNR